jgi:hypothetical protein
MNPTIGASGLRPKKQSLEAIGSVVAYDQLVPLTNITSAPQSQVLLVRIAKRLKGQEVGPYIKVVYKYGSDEASLPQEIFDGKSQWRFILKRDNGCDSSLGEMKATKPQTKEGEVTLPRLKFTSGTEGLEDKASLPCYVLKPGNYRAQKSAVTGSFANCAAFARIGKRRRRSNS